MREQVIDRLYDQNIAIGKRISRVPTISAALIAENSWLTT
jgi:hypothetical protein